MRKVTVLIFVILFIIVSCGKKKQGPSPQNVNVVLPDVKNIYAEVGDGIVEIFWVLPSDKNVTKIMVRRKENFPITSVTDGTEIYFSTLTNSVYDNTVSNNVVYYYKVFTSDGKHFSKGVQIKAIPKKPPDTLPPGDVYDVSVTAEQTYVKIFWKNPSDSDFAGVVIVKKESSCPQSEEDGNIVYSGTGTSFTDYDVKVFHTYCYGIFTHDYAGNFSAGVIVKAEPEDLTPPEDVPVWYVAAATNYVVISWLNPDDPDFDKVKILRNSHLVYSSTGSEEIYYDSNLASGVSYIYTIISCDQYDNCTEGFSREVTTLTQKDTTPPSPVTNLQINPYPPGNGLMLKWDNPPDPDFVFVNIYVSHDTCATSSLIYSGPASTYTDLSCGGNCVNGEKYCYTIFSVDSSMNMSTPVTGIGIPRDIMPPAPVSDFTAVSDSRGYVTLNWQNPEDKDFAGVKIFLLNKKCDENLYSPSYLETHTENGYPIVVSSTSINTFVDKNPPLPSDSRNLCYAISSFDDAGNLSPAPSFTVAVTDSTPPGMPESVNAEALSNGDIAFSWHYPNDPDISRGGIKILRRQALDPDDDYYLPCNSNSPVAIISYPQDSFLDITVAGNPGAYYNYTLCTYDEWLNYSTPYVLTIRSFDTEPPGPVSDVTYMANPGGNEVDVSWSLPSAPDLAGVKILRKSGGYPSSPSDPTAVTVFNGMGTELYDISVSNGITYYYAIYAYDLSGNYSTPVSFSIIPEDIVPPGNVTLLDFQDPVTSDVIPVTWVNPADNDFTGVTITKNCTSTPTSPEDGTIIYRGKKEKTIITQSRNTLCFYAFYTSDEVPNYSTGITTPYSPPYFSRITGGTFGEMLNSTYLEGNIFILYYSSALSRGVVAEKLTPEGILLKRAILKSYTFPKFLSLGNDGNYIYALVGEQEKATLFQLSTYFDSIKRIELPGNFDNGKLISCSSRVYLLLHPTGSSELSLYSISSDLSFSEKIIPGSREFSGTCVQDNALVYAYSDYQVTLGKVYDATSTFTTVASWGAYDPVITATSSNWSIIAQRISPWTSYLLSLKGYEGPITDSVWYYQFTHNHNFIGYLHKNGKIYFFSPTTQNVTATPITEADPDALTGLYVNGKTSLLFSDRQEQSLYFLPDTISSNRILLHQGAFYIYLEGTTTTTGDYLLAKEQNGRDTLINASTGITIASGNNFTSLTSDGEKLFLLKYDQTFSYETYQNDSKTDEVILPYAGDEGKMCVLNDKIYFAYITNSTLKFKLLSDTSSPQEVTGFTLNEPISFSLSCNSSGGVLSLLSGSPGNYTLNVYFLGGTVLHLLWSSLMHTYLPSYFTVPGNGYVDIFYNGDKYFWQRISIFGDPISKEGLLQYLIPAYINLEPAGKYVVFKDISRGDLYIGRYIDGKWFYSQVDRNGDTGSYPVVFSNGGNLRIYYISDGAIYRAVIHP